MSSDTPNIERLMGGLGHPEGPDVRSDGSIVFVETYTGKVLSWHEESGSDVVADCGGGPNACIVGADGAVYVTQNGGHVGGWESVPRVAPAILRCLDGVIDAVVTEVEGTPLLAPNDLVWGPDGALYFTDSGRFEPDARPDPGRICVARSDGTTEVLVETGHTYPNGIAVHDDGSIVWVESFDRRVRCRSTDGAVELLCTLPDGHVPDGIEIDSVGNIWVTVTGAGGLDVVSPEGEMLRHVTTGGVPLNCVFDGTGDLLVTDFGTFDTSGHAHMVGALLRAHVEEVGQAPHRGSLHRGFPTSDPGRSTS